MDKSTASRYPRHLNVVGIAIFMAVMGALGAWLVSRHASVAQHEKAARAAASLPAKMLWVWERPEKMRGINPATTGVAVLEKTIYLGASKQGAFISVQPREQPLVLPANVTQVAVVRLEATGSFAAVTGDPALLAQTTSELVNTSGLAGISGLQIDFDAKQSERGFYRRLLQRVRAQMPPSMPLTITALASWCSTDDWLAGLPLNDAIPMFFRMEPDRTRMLATAQKYKVTEPLCESSVGVSTHEPWPPDMADKRVYIFADRGWKLDLPMLLSSSSANLRTSMEYRR